jgi:nucleoside-diphosphate-sugar epimerase
MPRVSCPPVKRRPKSSRFRSPTNSVSVALVTGATGMVGSYIVEALLSKGWSVRAMSRSVSALSATFPDIEVVTGDILDEASFRRAASGCNTVFHCAAAINARSWDESRAANIDGTRNAIAAAEGARARLLLVSSVAVYGPSAKYGVIKPGEKTDERTELVPLLERAWYARSKRESEAMVLEAHKQGRVWATAIRPDVIYGRRDRQFVPRIARLMKYRVIPMLNEGRSTLAVVHAANVADGAILAATSDRAGGNVYNLTNDFDTTFRQFFELAGQGLGRAPLLVNVPVAAIRGFLKFARPTVRALTGGRLNLVSASTIDFIAADNPYSSERARRDLGWAPVVRPEVGVPEAFRFWRVTSSASAS